MATTAHAARLARQGLDDRLASWRNAGPPPVGGWIRAIRESLRMSSSDLALRLGTSRQAVAQMERSEKDGSIRLETLRRAAEALDCTLAYALVPNESLEKIVNARANDVAKEEARRVSHTMLLEDQEVGEIETERLVSELADKLKDSRRLWRL